MSHDQKIDAIIAISLLVIFFSLGFGIGVVVS